MVNIHHVRRSKIAPKVHVRVTVFDYGCQVTDIGENFRVSVTVQAPAWQIGAGIVRVTVKVTDTGEAVGAHFFARPRRSSRGLAITVGNLAFSDLAAFMCWPHATVEVCFLSVSSKRHCTTVTKGTCHPTCP